MGQASDIESLGIIGDEGGDGGKKGKDGKLPATGKTKNGTRVTFKSSTYLMYNSEWLRLSGKLVDINAYFNVAGDLPPLGVSPVMIDSAILSKILESNIGNTFGLEGLISGWSIESVTTWSFCKLNFAGLLAGFGYNAITGSYQKYKTNAEHDKGTQSQLPPE